MNREWGNHVGSMLLEYLDSDADASVVIVFANGSTNNKTTPETLANSHHGLRMTPRQSTHVVMTVLVLTGVQCTSAWLSHRFETVTLFLQGIVASQLYTRHQ